MEYRHINELQEAKYKDILNGMHYKIEDSIYPTRSEFAALYTYIKRTVRSKGGRYSQRELISAVPITGDNAIVKLRFMLDVFEEMKLLQVSLNCKDSDCWYDIAVKFVRGKVNLDKSLILKNLKSKQDKV